LQTDAILAVCIASIVVAVLALIAHRRLAGTAERAGLLSMLAYVLCVLAVLTALITGGFLLSLRLSG
jgi:hypothetical protein